MVFKKPDLAFSEIDYHSASSAGLEKLVALHDANGVPIFEKVTAESQPDIFESNMAVSSCLGLPPKDIYLCRDYDFCGDGAAYHTLDAIILNKELVGKLEHDEQKSLIAHERQHFEQDHSVVQTRTSLLNTVSEFFHNFGSMIPSLGVVGILAISCVIKFTIDLPTYTDSIENARKSQENERDSDAAAVKAAGALATLTYGKKMLLHHLEHKFEDGFTKEYLVKKVHGMKASSLGVLEQVSSGFGLQELLSSHPNPITRGRQIAELEGKKLEDIFPQVQQAR